MPSPFGKIGPWFKVLVWVIAILVVAVSMLLAFIAVPGCAEQGAVQVAQDADAIVDADVESLVKLVANLRAELTGVKASVQGDSITSWIYALGAAFAYPTYRILAMRWRHQAACETYAEITKRIIRQCHVEGNSIVVRDE